MIKVTEEMVIRAKDKIPIIKFPTDYQIKQAIQSAIEASDQIQELIKQNECLSARVMELEENRNTIFDGFMVNSFTSYQQWVNKASSWLTQHPRYGEYFKCVCFDSKGRICRRGADFMRARDEDCFPVFWVWESLDEAGININKPQPPKEL